MRLVAIAAAFALAFAPAAAAAQDVAISLRPGEVLLRVQAEGTDKRRPDVMAITAGVVTTGKTPKEALARNSELARRLIDAIRSAGVQPADVRTSDLRLEPQIDGAERERAGREDREPRIVGYRAHNRLAVTLRDLARAADIIEGLVAAGANEVNGPSFTLSDPRPAMRLARRAAVEEARQQANDYADALNMRVARVLRVSERQGFSNEDGTVVTGSAVRPPPIEPGEIDTRVDVWIDYALVPR